MTGSAGFDGSEPDQVDVQRSDRATGGVPIAAMVAAEAADAKLGQDTVVLAMDELFGVVDAFVITSGRNVRQIRTIVDEIESRVKEHGGRGPSAVEGLSDGTWVLMDYGDFVVHVFLEEKRDFYDLEHLWSAAPRIDWRTEVHAVR
ncbi:MAG TPA: ribosome silencing factor [Acidimicrobiales bacterium]|nr:ribosome silencing factor [Acidimicrobiales bacterium]